MDNLLKLLLGILALAISACASAPKEKPEYIKFTEKKNYVKTYSTYVDQKLLDKPKKKDVWAKVNLKQQRLRLIVDGQTAVDSPATTGKLNYETPTGVFAILEKTADKESNLYGKFYKDGKLVFTGSEKEYEDKNDGKKLEYDDYKGASLLNWLRLTQDGVGIHRSKGIHRNPASHGCIRVPAKTSNILYTKLAKGSLVRVVQNEPLVEKGKKAEVHNVKPAKPDLSKGRKTASYRDKTLPAEERLRLLRESKKQQKS